MYKPVHDELRVWALQARRVTHLGRASIRVHVHFSSVGVERGFFVGGMLRGGKGKGAAVWTLDAPSHNAQSKKTRSSPSHRARETLASRSGH